MVPVCVITLELNCCNASVRFEPSEGILWSSTTQKVEFNFALIMTQDITKK